MRREINNKISGVFNLLKSLYPSSDVQAYDNLDELRKTKKSAERKSRQEAKNQLLEKRLISDGQFFTKFKVR